MNKSKACIFPGQGSQKVGMLQDVANNYSIIKETFVESSSVLDYDLWELTQHNSEKINQTQYTQPAILAADVALYRLLQQKQEIHFDYFAGHSLGEYAAYVCAGSLDLIDAVKLVSERGRLMQESMPLGHGAMAAIIGMEDNLVLELCREASQQEILEPANFNSPGQIVIAGHLSAVERAIDMALENGAVIASLLPVSVPCHCSLLSEAAEKFKAYLQQVDFKSPQVPVVNNVDVTILDDPNAIRDSLFRQLYSPVRWVEVINYIKLDVEVIVECGPGRVLTGLNRRIDKNIMAYNINSMQTLDKTLSYLEE